MQIFLNMLLVSYLDIAFYDVGQLLVAFSVKLAY